jgi:hypothetical protein
VNKAIVSSKGSATKISALRVSLLVMASSCWLSGYADRMAQHAPQMPRKSCQIWPVDRWSDAYTEHSTVEVAVA